MALAANTALQTRNRNGQTVLDGVVLTAAVMYHHALAARLTTGTIIAAATDTTSKFVGLVEIENVDNDTAGITGDGTLRVNCISDIEVLIPCVTAITAGNVGGAAYIVDDNTISAEATLGPECGTITEFVATNSIWVALGRKAMASGT